MERRGAALCMDTASENRLALGVCFSEERDLLSQWRGYAADGAGFSITFYREALERIAGEHPESKLELTKIAYGYQDQEEINDIVRLLYDTFGEDAKLYMESGDIGSLALDFWANREKQEKYEKAARSLFKVKNGAFQEEKEWRLFTYGNLSSIDGVKLRGTGKALSPYIPIKISEKAVSKVTLGPSNKTPHHVLKFALEHNGFSRVSIETSTASYQAR